MSKISKLLDVFTHSGPGYEIIVPRRGDQTEVWLKKRRDTYPLNTVAWTALDNALDDYRLHADTRTPIGIHACEGRHCDCEES